MRRLIHDAQRLLGTGLPHGGTHHPPYMHEPGPHHGSPSFPPGHVPNSSNGWLPGEEVQSLAARLAPYVSDCEYWAQAIIADPGPGHIHSILTLAVLEELAEIRASIQQSFNARIMASSR